MPTQHIRLEYDLASSILTERSRLLCAYAISQLGNELTAADLERTIKVVVCILFEDLLQQLGKRMNSNLSLHELRQKKVKHSKRIKCWLFLCMEICVAQVLRKV